MEKIQLGQGEKKIQKYVVKLKKLLGKGAYAEVYLGRTIATSEPVAVKVIEKKIFANHYNLKNIQSEIEIMKRIEHKNIVKLLDVYQTANNMYIITQFCEDGDLQNFIKKKKRLPEKEALRFLKDILDGFKYLTELGITHRDLKPANILLKNGRCKISDFGFAKNLIDGDNTIMQSIVGTPLYMSPQILNRSSYTNKSDIWSTGLIFYELIHGYTPWPANNQVQLMNNIMNKPIIIDPSISAESKDFIRLCLKPRQEERISWQEAFNHPLLNELKNKKQAEQKQKQNVNYNERERLRSISANKKKRETSITKTTPRQSEVSKTPRSKLEKLFENITPTRQKRQTSIIKLKDASRNQVTPLKVRQISTNIIKKPINK